MRKLNLIEAKIISLIENKKGDQNRLNELLERVRANKQIYDSDIDYVERLSPTTKPEIKKPQQLTSSKPLYLFQNLSQSSITNQLVEIFLMFVIRTLFLTIQPIQMKSKFMQEVVIILKMQVKQVQ